MTAPRVVPTSARYAAVFAPDFAGHVRRDPRGGYSVCPNLPGACWVRVRASSVDAAARVLASSMRGVLIA